MIYKGNNAIAEIYRGNTAINEIYRGSNLVYRRINEVYLMQGGTVQDGYILSSNGALNGSTGNNPFKYYEGQGLEINGTAPGNTYYGRAWINAIDLTKYKTLTFIINNSASQWRFEKYPDAGNHRNYDFFNSSRFVKFGIASNTATGTTEPNFLTAITVDSGAVGEKLRDIYTIDITSITRTAYPTVFLKWVNSGLYTTFITDIYLS